MIEVDAPPALAAAAADQVEEVGEADGDWLWILDGTARPERGALRALLEAAERLAPVCAPALLASQVVGADGALAAGHEPVPSRGLTQLAMTTVELRVLHVEAVPPASVLVRPGAVRRRSGLVWAATGPGFVVPASHALATATPSYGRRAAALLLGPGLGPRERIRVALEVSERVGRRARRGRSS